MWFLYALTIYLLIILGSFYLFKQGQIDDKNGKRCEKGMKSAGKRCEKCMKSAGKRCKTLVF